MKKYLLILLSITPLVGPIEKVPQTPLYKAIENHCETKVLELIAHGADVNKITRFTYPEIGLTRLTPQGTEGEFVMTEIPLHQACTWGNQKVVAALLAGNADVNQQDHRGKTALHNASRMNHPTVIQMLNDEGALSLPIPPVPEIPAISEKNELSFLQQHKTPILIACGAGSIGIGYAAYKYWKKQQDKAKKALAEQPCTKDHLVCKAFKTIPKNPDGSPDFLHGTRST